MPLTTSFPPCHATPPPIVGAPPIVTLPTAEHLLVVVQLPVMPADEAQLSAEGPQLLAYGTH